MCGHLGGIISYRVPRGTITEVMSLLGTRTTTLVLLTSGPAWRTSKDRPVLDT